MNENPPVDAPSRGHPCPICGKPATAAAEPFCSKRCADIDLHRWLGGVYVVPSHEDPPDGLDRPESSEE